MKEFFNYRLKYPSYVEGLNYIFNNYNKNNLFKDVVTSAMQSGFTEPDPKIDLSGIEGSKTSNTLEVLKVFSISLSPKSIAVI